MKQAVIKTGGKQYLVHEGQELDVELLTDKKKFELEAMLVIDDKKVHVGSPIVKDSKVMAEIVTDKVNGPKIKIMKFKPKKRIKKLTGHRQKFSRIKINSIGK